MNMPEDRDVLDELKTLYEELKSYKRLLNLKGRLSDKNRLRETLVRKVGALKTVVIELTGKEHIQRFGMVYNIWDVGLSGHRVTNICDVALDYCIDAVNEAIGKLESDIKKGIRDEAGGAIEKPIKKQSLGKEIRKQLSGTPVELAPHIARVAQEFTFRGLKYWALEELNKSSQVSKQLRIICGSYFGPMISFIGGEDDEEEEIPRHSAQDIGVITIQSLLGNKALFIARVIPSSFDSDGSYFDSFLARLSVEFKNLGFEKSRVEKIWQWIKSHKIWSIIIAIITLVAAVIYLIDYFT